MTVKTLTLQKAAKINPALDVCALRPDGYHLVRMIMQTVSLYDTVTLTRETQKGITLKVSDPRLPADRWNLMVRAAELLFMEFDIPGGLSMDLQKEIPLSAGLAGGSADAAAVIEGMNELFGLGLTLSEMQKYGLRLGADVPFSLMGGTALAENIGEELTALPPFPDFGILLVHPDTEVATKAVYRGWDALKVPFHPDVEGFIQALLKGDRERIPALLGNGLEAVSRELCPKIPVIEEALLDAGALGASMSGSGPTVFGLFEDLGAAENAADPLRARFPGADVLTVRPVNGPAHRADSGKIHTK